jgi:hypothetical protein
VSKLECRVERSIRHAGATPGHPSGKPHQMGIPVKTEGDTLAQLEMVSILLLSLNTALGPVPEFKAFKSVILQQAHRARPGDPSGEEQRGLPVVQHTSKPEGDGAEPERLSII